MRPLALLLCPILTAIGAFFFPPITGLAPYAAAIAFVTGAGSALLALTLAAEARADRLQAVLAGFAALALGGAAVATFIGLRGLAVVTVVNLALVTGAHAIGGAIGTRVLHAGHLLPACAVAAAADLASVAHPSGPSHAIASSETALSLLAVSGPIPGAEAVAPVLGIGDLMFIALALGAALAHGVSRLRVALAASVGLTAAGGLAAWLQTEIPALVPLGIAIALGVPAFRRVRAEDRQTTALAIGASIAIAAAMLVSARLRSP